MWVINTPKPKPAKKDKKAEHFVKIRERIEQSHNPYNSLLPA